MAHIQAGVVFSPMGNPPALLEDSHSLTIPGFIFDLAIDLRTWPVKSPSRWLAAESAGRGAKWKIRWPEDAMIAEWLKMAVGDEQAKLAGFEPAPILQASGFAGGR